MFQEILSNPLKLAMAIFLVILEVPAITMFVLLWWNAFREAKKQEREKK